MSWQRCSASSLFGKTQRQVIEPLAIGAPPRWPSQGGAQELRAVAGAQPKLVRMFCEDETASQQRALNDITHACKMSRCGTGLALPTQLILIARPVQVRAVSLDQIHAAFSSPASTRVFVDIPTTGYRALGNVVSLVETLLNSQETEEMILTGQVAAGVNRALKRFMCRGAAVSQLLAARRAPPRLRIGTITASSSCSPTSGADTAPFKVFMFPRSCRGEYFSCHYSLATDR